MALRCTRCLELVGQDHSDLWHKAVGLVSYDPSSISFQQGWALSSRRWTAATSRSCVLDSSTASSEDCLNYLTVEDIYVSSV